MLRYYLYSGFAIIGTFSVVGFILGFRKLSSFRCKSGFVCFRPNSISASHNNDSYRLAKTCRITGKHKAKLLELESLNQEGHIPDFIGIGVRKCGTGVYMNFLRKHGSFSFPIWKNYETEYFSTRKKCGLKWYLRRFKLFENDKYFIEKTPHYFYSAPASIPQDILELNPKIKAVLLLCDPTTRAFSCYVHHYIRDYFRRNASFITQEFHRYVLHRLPKLQNTLSKMNKSEKELYLLKIWHSDQECLIAGLYSVHIKRWTTHFSPSQLLILNGEDMTKNPGPEYLKLQQFLGVPRKFRPKDWTKHNTTGHFCLHPPANRSLLYCQDDGRKKARTRTDKQNATKPSEEIIEMLKEFYKPYNEQLYKVLSKNFHWL